jgi:hypothetical protein
MSRHFIGFQFFVLQYHVDTMMTGDITLTLSFRIDLRHTSTVVPDFSPSMFASQLFQGRSLFMWNILVCVVYNTS